MAMFRMFCCALCALACSPVFADILVQEGDYYPTLLGTEPVLVTGGRVDQLTLGGFPTVIEGGSVGRITDSGNTPITIRGGEVTWDSIVEGRIIFEEQHPQVTFEGYEFDVERINAASWRVTGLLYDFSSLSVRLSTDPDLCHGSPAVCVEPAITFLLHDLPIQPGDANGDGVVDLVDLNTIRNGFGSSGPGDLDGNGIVGLEDLNLVRNHFGEAVPVPEPTTTALLLVGMTALTLLRWWP